MREESSSKGVWERINGLFWAGAVVSLFCLLFILANRSVFDLDIWLHLKAGEIIANSGVVPAQDPFSFTFPGKSWIDHEWLFQLASHLTYSRFGLDGLIGLAGYVIVFSFLILYFIGYKIGKSRIAASALLFMAIFASVSRFNIRPDIFSVFFFAIYLFILRLCMEKKALWLLPLVQIVWVNFHGYFFLGPLLVFLFVCAEFLRRRVKSLPWQWKEQFALSDLAYRRLKQVFLLVILASLVNPFGIKGALYPSEIFRGLFYLENRIFFKYILELQPTFSLLEYPLKFYFVLAGLCLVSLLAGFRRLKLVDIILAVVFFLFSLTMRNIVFFVFSAYLVIISSLQPLFSQLGKRPKVIMFLGSKLCVFGKIVLAASLIVWAVWKIDSSSGSAEYDFRFWKFRSAFSGLNENRYPKGAASFLLKNNVSVNVFNDFNSGAYLIGVAYPRIKVFIDGRTEFYGPQFYKQHQDILAGDFSIFEQVAERYDIKAVILSLTAKNLPKIISPIYQSQKWKMVFVDDNGVVFLKNVEENRQLISRYAIDLKNYNAPGVNLIALGLQRVYPAPYLKRAAIFDLLKADFAVIQECRQALKIMPDCAAAYHFLGKAYLRQKQYKKALASLRSALVLRPANPEALAELGACLRELGEPRIALKIFNRAIRFDQGCCSAYYQTGITDHSLDDLPGAVRALEKAVLYCPNSSEYHLKLGEAFFAQAKALPGQGYLQKSRKELLKASKLNTSRDLSLEQEIQERIKTLDLLPSE